MVNGDPLKRYTPEEKLRYDTVRYGQDNKFGPTTVCLLYLITKLSFSIISKFTAMATKLLDYKLKR